MKIHSFFYFLWPLAVLWTGTFLGGKLPFDWTSVHTEDWILCNEWKFIPSFASFTDFLCCELVQFQEVSCLWTSMFVHTHDWFVMGENSFLLLLAVLWTGALLEGKLPLNEHVCAYSRVTFLWWKIRSLYLLYPLAVLWTDALLAGKLSLNEHVCACILKIGFCVMSEKLFLLPSLPTCCVVNWWTVSR